MNRNVLYIITILLFSIYNSYEIIDLKIEHITTSYIGKKGLLFLEVDNNEKKLNQIVKINEKKTFFETLISGKDSQIYKINCGFIKGIIDSEFYIFCEIKENINAGEYTIQINQNLNYLNYQINISQESKIYIIKYNYNIPFLYSDTQFIEVKDNINLYTLKFNIYSYNNEPLILSTIGNLLPLDNCEEKNNELICVLEKNKILSIMEDKEAWFKLEYVAHNEYQTEFKFANYINIKYISNTKKKNIKVNIKRLVSNCTENYKYIAYETDITDIPIISTDIYSGFYLDFENSSGCEYFRRKCHFVKYVIGPLLILCKMEGGNGEYKLKEIEKEIDIEYLNVNYNFIIQPINNTETFFLSEVKNESYGIINYQNILDFRKNESLEIVYYMKNAKEIKNIKLNSDSRNDLYCEDNNKIKSCKIHKSHFNGKESGYYYTTYINNCRNRAIIYEFSPIKVILN